ncbi:hypothetical protein [Streptosporangium subroseum]|uniref:hypothetical protein n=1 Tax=Streptosporangium subroseum TaxID=106412 RepID=UPI0011806A9C|nr:hypothetical protein [Streptosporangium subroseum]
MTERFSGRFPPTETLGHNRVAGSGEYRDRVVIQGDRCQDVAAAFTRIRRLIFTALMPAGRAFAAWRLPDEPGDRAQQPRSHTGVGTRR